MKSSESEGDVTQEKPGLLRRGLGFLGRMVRRLLAAGLGATLGVGVVGYVTLTWYNKQLPDDLSAVSDFQPEKLSQVFSDDGELIGEFFLERRIVVPLEKIPRHVSGAFLAAEDGRFYQHPGLDFLGILRAMVVNLQAGAVVQGGSTITQQVVKNLLLTPERSLDRKVKEAILSFRIENELTKDQILAVYLNMVYLGHGAYGVQAAAQAYYGKDVEDLDVAEAALMGGLVKAPGKWSPYKNFERAKERQLYVLDQMVKLKMITRSEADDAAEEPLAILSSPGVNMSAAPDFVEHVRRMVRDKYGGEMLLTGGLKIYTTLNMKMQRAARVAVKKGVDDLTTRVGWHGPDRQIPQARWDDYRKAVWKEVQAVRVLERRGVAATAPPQKDEIYQAVLLEEDGTTLKLGVGPYEALLDTADVKGRVYRQDEEEKWVQKTVADVVSPGSVMRVRWLGEKAGVPLPVVTLQGAPAAQSALLAAEPGTGYVRAMVGGYDFAQSRFNRALQAYRQPGSSFKPFIYATALALGFTETSVMEDGPITFQLAGGQTWSPGNYGNKYYGKVTLRTALAKSLNSVAIRLLNQVGVDRVIRTCRRLGVTAPLENNLALALGSTSLTLGEMTQAYTIFASNGRETPLIYIRRIEADDGKVLEDNTVPPSRGLEVAPATPSAETPPPGYALDPAVAFVLSDMMRNVVNEGTARKAKVLGRPAAGKTGTTNGYVDAWFMGFTADLVAGVWVGTDARNPLGPDETGGKAALPVWIQFMQEAHEGLPPRDFTLPPGVVYQHVDPASGRVLKAGRGGAYIPYRADNLPGAPLPAPPVDLAETL